MRITVDPYSTLMFYCPHCDHPMSRSPNQLRDEPEIICPGCDIGYTPNVEELIERKQRLFDAFAEYKKQFAGQKKD